MIAILFGMAFTATVLGTAAYIHSTQSLSVASHAQVQAQLKAWTGVEVVREYLASLQSQSSANLPALAVLVNSAPQPLTFTGVTGFTATLTAVNSTTAPTQFTAQITGTTASNTTAQAYSTVQAVYAVTTTSGANQVPVLNFNRNLELGGSVNVISTTGNTQYAINVLGDVTTGGNSITGVAVINSTGTINIGSGSAFTTLNSNCDVVLTGSVHAVTVNAQRNFCATGGAYVSGTALANGSASSAASYTANGTISARASPSGSASCTASGTSANGTAAATCPAPSVTGVDLSAGGAGAAVVNSDGNVSVAGTVTTLHDAGHLVMAAGAHVNGGDYGISPPTLGSGAVNLASYVPNDTVNITAASPVSLSSAQFNAYDVKVYANYVFTVNTSGYMQVAISNVNGITNGTYYIGNYDSSHLNYYCSTITSGSTTSSVTCATPAVSSSGPLCWGNSAYNSCISYSSGSWTVGGGKSMPPGIAWFQGNLTVSSGIYYNTFIATGNITTSGSDTVYAPNYAGYSGTVGGVSYAPYGMCGTNTYFYTNYPTPQQYPTQFCNTTTQTFTSTASNGLGNYVFLAGSWTGSTYPGQAGYIGGNVSVGASSYAYGDIKAGNEFQSGGSATVAGGVTALAEGTASNSIGGSTTFNYTNIPATEDVTGGASGTGEGVSTATTTISLQWARYL